MLASYAMWGRIGAAKRWGKQNTSLPSYKDDEEKR